MSSRSIGLSGEVEAGRTAAAATRKYGVSEGAVYPCLSTISPSAELSGCLTPQQFARKCSEGPPGAPLYGLQYGARHPFTYASKQR
ncbi:MAG: hypothetical protein ACLFWB_03700 [Armatimonadota bacterium]